MLTSDIGIIYTFIKYNVNIVYKRIKYYVYVESGFDA